MKYVVVAGNQRTGETWAFNNIPVRVGHTVTVLTNEKALRGLGGRDVTVVLITGPAWDNRPKALRRVRDSIAVIRASGAEFVEREVRP